jgi:hypothetical protein
MFRSIGVVIVLWYLASLFSESFSAMDDALTASLHLVETTAERTEQELRR